MSVFGFFFGEMTVKGEARDGARLLNLCMALDISYRRIKSDKDGMFLAFSLRDGDTFLQASQRAVLPKDRRSVGQRTLQTVMSLHKRAVAKL